MFVSSAIGSERGLAKDNANVKGAVMFYLGKFLFLLRMAAVIDFLDQRGARGADFQEFCVWRSIIENSSNKIHSERGAIS